MIITSEIEWYDRVIRAFKNPAATVDLARNSVQYNQRIKSDESHVKPITPEELVHATVINLLCSDTYNYSTETVGHEIHFAHGSKGSKSDEVDVIVHDAEERPFALFELKAHQEFEREKYQAIQYQLFGTATLTGSPHLLVYATVEPRGEIPSLKAVCIDYMKYKDFDVWRDAGEPHSTDFPIEYRDIDYEPLTNQGNRPLDVTATLAEFRAIAISFHNEFFGEHPDNAIFVNLVKCLLAKIYDERSTRIGDKYGFQVFQRAGRPETAPEVFDRINTLYKDAYIRFVDPRSSESDEINTRDFSEQRVKTVVQALQQLSITMGAARNSDVIGAFFEEILRSGFKQDRGMYFTHDNLARFMVEAVGIEELSTKTWSSANHPSNRLPYIIDPACGSGTFLLHCMQNVTSTIRTSKKQLVADDEAMSFYRTRLNDERPNTWAEDFIYGLDPKFDMAITARVNMVLHGDGSAHIYKEDAFSPISKYSTTRLRACNDPQRSVPKSRYRPDVIETFDLVVSNPPFGVTLAAETRARIEDTFSLPKATPSEGLFIERCFQLLKPGGRLAVILPESLLNGKEMINVRIFLYRMFNIKAIVSMPRNLFVDTPTKTSILFAQKKLAEEIEEWDDTWGKSMLAVQVRVATARRVLTKRFCKDHTAAEVANAFNNALTSVVSDKKWFSKGGANPSLLWMTSDWTNRETEEAVLHYRAILNTSDFRRTCVQYVFQSVVKKLSYDFPAFEVDEVGYKLSKRGEQARPNALLKMRSRISKRDVTNFHLSDEECELIIDTGNPITVLDEIRKGVTWS